MARRLFAILVSCAAVASLSACEPQPVGVDMHDNFYTPATTSVPRGGQVRWTNVGFQVHSATGDAPLRLFNTNEFGHDGSFTITFPAAGTFDYFCQVHSGMQGTIEVPASVTPTSGTTATSFRVTVASAAAAGGFQYVVQRKAPGGVFQGFRTFTATSTTFTPTSPGTYEFRAALKRISSGALSEYSDPVAITVS